jgi:hypothetical protein
MDATEQNTVAREFSQKLAYYYNNYAPQYDYIDIGGCDRSNLHTAAIYAWFVNERNITDNISQRCLCNDNTSQCRCNDDKPARNIMVTEYCYYSGISMFKLAHMDALHSITISPLYIPSISHVQLLMCITYSDINTCLMYYPGNNNRNWEVVASASPSTVVKFYNAPLLHPRQFAIRIIFKHNCEHAMITVGLKYLFITKDDLEAAQLTMKRHFM